jgi:SAM-dependent methyltransferase
MDMDFESTEQQTARSFKDKWENFSSDFLDVTTDESSDIFRWIMPRNGFASPVEFKEWVSTKTRILDAGCGNGRVTRLLNSYSNESAEIVGIDLVAAEVAAKNTQDLDRVTVYQADLVDSLERFGLFDLIYCQEVLHHTENPKLAFEMLTNQLSNIGEIAIYVYKEKAPIREFSDDYIRNQISSMGFDEVKSAITQITSFAKELSESKSSINVPAIDCLGIESGEWTPQRLIYNFMFKNFWNDELSWNENYAINYDWYHPSLCSRHTLEEVRHWFTENSLEIINEVVDPYGITVCGRRLDSTRND